jgi:hypothetical protein
MAVRERTVTRERPGVKAYARNCGCLRGATRKRFVAGMDKLAIEI